MNRQDFLDSLKVGDEVSGDYRASGRPCKTYRVQEIIQTSKYGRAFLVNRMRFSPAGGFISDNNDLETWPGPCCLEDPDSESLGWGSQPTRREVSRRQHALTIFAALSTKSLTTDQLVSMIKIKFPDYVPEWEVVPAESLPVVRDGS